MSHYSKRLALTATVKCILKQQFSHREGCRSWWCVQPTFSMSMNSDGRQTVTVVSDGLAQTQPQNQQLNGDCDRDTERQNKINRGVDGVARPLDSVLGTKVFVSQFSAITGQQQWTMQPADYDYHQEIARSAYADMLHDTERNQKYYLAIKRAVEELRRRGQSVRVLDIGTGTGLLSMMAASAGADSITACEAFEPMANCAEEVIKANGFADRVKVVHARSTDVTVGQGKDMEQPADLLVTEVFDTELIGEGAIETYTHAHQHLLQENCIVVPRAANMYVQPVSSHYIRHWNDLQPITTATGERIEVPPEFSQCGGAPSLHDLQLDKVDQDVFTAISTPLKVFRFDFSQRGRLQQHGSSRVEVMSDVDGVVDAVFMWWDLEMDHDGQTVLSCAPRWAHPDGSHLPWRDHWMQAIFYPSRRLPVKKGEKFHLISQHDDYSLWFETTPLGQKASVVERPVCEYGLHVAVSRTRLAMLNDPYRNKVYLNLLQKHVTKSTVCVCISDSSLLPLMAAKLGAKKVFAVESNTLCARVTQRLMRHNKLDDVITIIEKPATRITATDLQGFQVGLVIGEPHFQSQVLPWDGVHLWYGVSVLRDFLSPSAVILPATMTVFAMAMTFTDLWKIRAPVGLCEEFDISIFDNMIKRSSDVVDENVEPQPLWEYSGTPVSPPVAIMSVSFSQPDPTTTPPSSQQHCLSCSRAGEVNGVALWCQFDFGDGQTVSTGPQEPPQVGQPVKWDRCCRQGVYLTPSPLPVTPGHALRFTSLFTPAEGTLTFNWTF